MRFDTRAVHGTGPSPDGGVVPAIQLSSTFAQPHDGTFGEFVYQRGGNPTRAAAERLLASLEPARHAVTFATGMAAIASVFSLLQRGDRVLTGRSVYGGTYRYLSHYLPRQGIAHAYLEDVNHLEPAELGERVDGVLIETPTNPTLEVVDIERLAGIVHERGGWLAVDNTFATSYLQRPLDLGADLVVYSATKYLGGHGDVLAGAVLTNDDGLADELRFCRRTVGGALSPFDAYSLIRGVKTLGVRIDRQQANAERIARFLRGRPEVDAVHTPGSRSAEEAAIQARQASGPGAVLAFELAPELDLPAFLGHLGFIDYAVSLGGVETLICTPASMTHESFSAADRAAAGISDRLIRLAVGIEDADDLIDLLGSALDAARRS